jgi:hypothetical protein
MQEELKKNYAKELLKFPGDPFSAALGLAGDDTSLALIMANEWVKDPIVINELSDIRAARGQIDLPTREDLAHNLWNKAHNGRVDISDYVQLVKLYAQIMDFMPKKDDNKKMKPMPIIIEVFKGDDTL